MELKVFLKNTMELVETMIEKEEKDMGEINKKWKKELYTMLKVGLNFDYQGFYISIKNSAIMQLQQSPFSGTNGLARSENSPKVASNFSLSSFFLSKSNKSSPLPISEDNPIGKKFINPESSIIEGILIRKHYKDADFEKSKTKSWRKFWCVIRVHRETSLELAMFKIAPKTSEKEFDECEKFDGPYFSANVTTPSNKTAPVPKELDERLRHPILASVTMPYKLTNQDPEIISLIHSFAFRAEYSNGKKRNVFILHLSDGSEWLFSAPNEAAANVWVNSVNYHAGRKSKQPMRGGMSSTNYGWSDLEDNNSPPKNQTIVQDTEIENAAMKSNITSVVLLSNLCNTENKIKGQKVKLSPWNTPVIPTRLVSKADEVRDYFYYLQKEQLQLMIQQIDFVTKELDSHEAKFELMNKLVILFH